MKVCFIGGTLGRGGAEQQLIYMLQALQGAGIETRVLCLTRGEEYEEQIRDLGIEIDWVGRSKSRIARLLSIVNNLRDRPADILQSSHFYTNIYAGAAARFLQVPGIGAIRNDLTSEIAANGAFGSWQLRLPTLLVANSELAVKRARSLGIEAEKIHFVRNVISVDKWSCRPRRLADNGIHILFVGRLVAQKNPQLFVQLAARLASKLSENRLTFEIAGDGPLRTELEQQVAESSLSPHQFLFSGNSSNIGRVYQSADIVVLTSNHEGTPNVILEAMACCIPVIATKVGGVPEILNDGRGFVVNAGDLDSLCAAVEKLVLNPNLRSNLREKSKRYVEKAHSFSYLAERLIHIYAKSSAGAWFNARK